MKKKGKEERKDHRERRKWTQPAHSPRISDKYPIPRRPCQARQVFTEDSSWSPAAGEVNPDNTRRY